MLKRPRRWIRRLLEARGYVVCNTRSRDYYAHDSLFTTNNDHFRGLPAFQAAYARGVLASCGVDPQIEWRLHVALWAALAAVRIPGDFVGCGVNAGFVSSAIMQRLGWQSVGKRFYLIDTFTGPVFAQYSGKEVHTAGSELRRRQSPGAPMLPISEKCGRTMATGLTWKLCRGWYRRCCRRWALGGSRSYTSI